MTENKIDLATLVQGLTVQSAMEGTQISVIKTEMGFDELSKLVYIMLDDLRVSIGIKKDEEDKELEGVLIATAIKIITNYWFLKLEELTLFFDGCKEGKYGKTYGKISAVRIFELLNVYDQQRTDAIANKHLDTKYADSGGARTSEDITVKLLFSHEEKLAEYKKKMEE